MNTALVSEILNIQDFKEEKSIVEIPAEYMLEANTEQQKTKDFHDVRDNIIDIIEKTYDVLDDAVSIAKQSGEAKSFDALAKLMNSMISANESLLRLHKQRGEILLDNKRLHEKPVEKKAEEEDNSKQVIVERAVFVGTPAELLKVINQAKANNDSASTE